LVSRSSKRAGTARTAGSELFCRLKGHQAQIDIQSKEEAAELGDVIQAGLQAVDVDAKTYRRLYELATKLRSIK